LLKQIESLSGGIFKLGILEPLNALRAPTQISLFVKVIVSKILNNLFVLLTVSTIKLAQF